jgi:hypothetical protein
MQKLPAESCATILRKTTDISVDLVSNKLTISGLKFSCLHSRKKRVCKLSTWLHPARTENNHQFWKSRGGRTFEKHTSSHLREFDRPAEQRRLDVGQCRASVGNAEE